MKPLWWIMLNMPRRTLLHAIISYLLFAGHWSRNDVETTRLFLLLNSENVESFGRIEKTSDFCLTGGIQNSSRCAHLSLAAGKMMASSRTRCCVHLDERLLISWLISSVMPLSVDESVSMVAMQQRMDVEPLSRCHVQHLSMWEHQQC